MRRMRVTIAGWMVALAVVAAGVAVLRSLKNSPAWALIEDPGGDDFRRFAFGVVPMAVLLSLMGLSTLSRMVRVGKSGSFSIGFQIAGWKAVLMFGVLAALAPQVVLIYEQFLYFHTIIPWCDPMDGTMPNWASMLLLDGFSGVIFTVPELAIASLGGWFGARTRLALVAGPSREVADHSP